MKKYLILWCLCLSAMPRAQARQERIASLGYLGDITDVDTPTRAGVALIGGGGDVAGAFQWMIERSGGGNVVIVRASGNYLYNRTIDSLGKVQSVETLLINSRELADHPETAEVIRKAEMLFIAGGDQSNYMNYWRGTQTAAAINYLLNEKKAPVGGTSAGCAILTGLYYSGENGSASASALENPYDPLVTLYNNDLLNPPFLKHVISDQHYVTRKRQGRHVVFMGRIIRDWKLFPNGIAPDEKTAVCIDENGHARVFGEGKAYFLRTHPKRPPEQCATGKPLHWKAKRQAIEVYEIQGAPQGHGHFSVSDFEISKATGGKRYYWWVENGLLKLKEKTR